ncbi:hypothetical protein NUW58_g8511 [Xylaria curta]|uniref:Uncharacterized protein n=1 Tax=Xylaria curta TaxID=42375 RepID=A0ACC1N750_9PEZI|nr:hypothetical protein NUW58_g8511 [Xylaria curta]
MPAKKQQELQATYSNYKNTLQQLAQKIGDVEQESEEHKLVLETLEPLPDDRKCFRMINGVLVERTVKDVIPALRTNAEGLKKVLDDLVKQYKTKQDDLEKWKLQSQAVEPSVKGVSVPNDSHRQGCRVCGFGGAVDSRAGRAQKRLSLAGWGSTIQSGGLRRRPTPTSPNYFHHTPQGCLPV